MDETHALLQRAYRYIRHDRTQEAQQILRPLLEREYDNVHAWWLLAHAVTDPQEIRHALTRVLTLDPDYPNADKARQLLSALDERMAVPAELETFDLAEEDFLTRLEEAEQWAELEGTFAPPEPRGEALPDYETAERPLSAPEPLEALILDEEETEIPAEMGSGEDDPFAHLEEDLLAEPFQQEDLDTADLIKAIEADQVDLEALLKLEEEEAAQESAVSTRRRTRRPGLLFWLLAVSIALIGLAVLILRLATQEETVAQDPGPLAPVAIEDVTLASILKDLNDQLSIQALGQEYRAVVASSSLGKTLYVEFCLPSPIGLDQAVFRGMELAAQYSSTAVGQVEAVGVSVNNCLGEKHDTLYRAQVPLEAAQRYLNGELGTGETALASFQALWTVS